MIFATGNAVNIVCILHINATSDRVFCLVRREKENRSDSRSNKCVKPLESIVILKQSTNNVMERI